MKSKIFLTCIFISILTISLSSAPAKKTKGTGTGNKITLVISRPGETSDKTQINSGWFAALTEQYLYFKFLGTESINIVSKAKVNDEMRLRGNYGLVTPDNLIFAAAENLKATHVLVHSYGVNERDNTIDYFLELIETKTKTVVYTYDNSFTHATLSASFEELFVKIVEALKLSPTPVEMSVLKRPLLSNIPKDLSSLGNLIAKSAEPNANMKEIGERILAITKRNTTYSLAFYSAAEIFDAQNNFEQAAKMYNGLILRNGIYATGLYLAAAKNLRKAKLFESAIRTLGVAEDKGFKSIHISIEKAKSYEIIGKHEMAKQLFVTILKTNPSQPDALLFSIRQNIKNKKYSSAIAKADKLIKQQEFIGDALLEKGRALMATNKDELALDALQSALQAQPDNSDALQLLSELHFKQKKYNIAGSMYEELLLKNPTSIAVLLRTAESLRMGNDLKKSYSILKNYQKNFTNNARVIREIGLAEFDLGDTVNACRNLEQIKNTQKSDMRINLVLGDIYLAKKQYAKALIMYERAEKLVKDVNDKIRIQVSMANMYSITGKNLKAEQKIRPILLKKPKYELANKILGDALHAQKKKKSALTYYLKERTYHGYSNYLQQRIASIFFELKDFTNAEKETKKLITKDPTNNKAYLNLAVMMLNKKLPDKASEYINQAAVSGKIDKKVYLNLADTYFSLKNYPKSISSYLKYLKLDPKAENALKNLATVYDKSGYDSLKARTYEKIYMLFPGKNLSYLGKAGSAFYNTGLKKDAYKIYTAAIAKGLKDNEILINMADMEFSKKDYNKTVQHLKNVTGSTVTKKKFIKMMAMSYYNLKKYKEATSYLDQYSLAEPKNQNLAEFSALANEKSSNLAKAAKHYVRYLSLGATSKSQDYAFKLAQIYEKLKQSTNAIARYKLNITSYPADIRNYKHLADLSVAKNLLTDAAQTLSLAVKKCNVTPSIELQLSKLYIKLKKNTLAAISYERYLKSVPSDSLSWVVLSKLHYEAKAYTKAIQPLYQASVLMPKNMPVNKMLAHALYNTAQYAKAIEPLKKVYNSNNKDPKIITLLVTCFEKVNDKPNTILYMKKLAKIKTSDYSLQSKLAGIFLKSGKTDDAIPYLEASVRIKPADIASHKLLMGIFEKKKLKEKWILHINAAVKYAPNDASAWFEKARYHIKFKESVRAETAIKKAIALNPKNDKALYQYATMLETKKDYANAYKYINKATKIAPKNPKYQFCLAKAAYLSGKNAIAEKAIAKALISKQNNPELIQWAGLIYYNAGNKKKAEQYLLQGQMLDNSCSFCDEKLGILYYEKKKFNEAKKHLEKAIKLNGPMASTTAPLARIYDAKGQKEKALENYELAHSLNRKDDEIYASLADIYLAMNKISDAEALMKKNSGRKQTVPISIIHGRICEATQNYAVALLSYQSVLKKKPQNGDAHAGLARLHMRQKRYDEAIMSFSMAMVEKSDDINIFAGMAKAYLMQQNFDAAMELLEDLKGKVQNNSDALYVLAAVYSKKGKHSDAVKSLERSIEIDGQNPDLHFAIGNEYKETLQYEFAISSYLKATELDKSKGISVYKRIGDICYKKLRNNKMAKEYYSKYVAAGGNNSKINKILKTLKTK